MQFCNWTKEFAINFQSVPEIFYLLIVFIRLHWFPYSQMWANQMETLQLPKTTDIATAAMSCYTATARCFVLALGKVYGSADDDLIAECDVSLYSGAEKAHLR